MRRDDPTVTSTGPRCFLHILKCAGSSFWHGLRAAMPEARFNERTFDSSTFADFSEFDLLRPEMRALIAVEEEEVLALRDCDVVTGHLSLSTLLRIAPAHRIATVLREPRARLLSFLAYARLTPGLSNSWLPYAAFERALGPIAEVLADPRLAALTDNLICRMLLFPDSRLPPARFIDAARIEEIAAAAIERLDGLGFVGVIEVSGVWAAFGRFFDVELEGVRVNVTGADRSHADSTSPLTSISSDAIELVEQRSSADAIVYRHALESLGMDADSRRRLEHAAFATQLLRLGDVAGPRAAETSALTNALATAHAESERLHQEIEVISADLARHRAWLDGMKRSASWRLTAPLRTAKRALRR